MYGGHVDLEGIALYHRYITSGSSVFFSVLFVFSPSFGETFCLLIPHPPTTIMMEKQANDAYFAAVGETARHQSIDDGKEAASAIGSSSASHVFPDGDYIPPTKQELLELRHVPDTINWAAYRSYR